MISIIEVRKAVDMGILNFIIFANKYSIINTGPLYHHKTIEVIPNFNPSPTFFPKSLINIRLDYHFNLNRILAFANQTAELALNGNISDIEALKAASLGAMTVEETRLTLVTKIGENMNKMI